MGIGSVSTQVPPHPSTRLFSRRPAGDFRDAQSHMDVELAHAPKVPPGARYQAPTESFLFLRVLVLACSLDPRVQGAKPTPVLSAPTTTSWAVVRSSLVRRLIGRSVWWTVQVVCQSEGPA